MDTLLSLPHFSSTTMAPLFEVPRVLNDVDHPYHKKLHEDINSIPAKELKSFIESGRVNHLIRENGDPVGEYKMYFIEHQLWDQIAMLRKERLLNFSGRPDPYDHEELREVSYDRNFLVNADDFESYIGGFKRGNEVFTLLPSLDHTNSCYWLVQELNNPELDGKLKIRLDPLIHQHEDVFNPMMFKMQVYGRELNWDRITNLREPEQSEFLPEFPSSNDILKTQIIWKPDDKEISFTCEELPKEKMLSVRGSRYFHAILERDTGRVIHCDGAIRFYEFHEFQNRIQNHIKSNEVTRIGKRVKVFQVDGEISHQCLINFITSFFVWNHDVLNYFN